MTISIQVDLDTKGDGTYTDITTICERATWQYGRFGGLDGHRAGTCTFTLSAPRGENIPLPLTTLAASEKLAGRRVRVIGQDSAGELVPVTLWLGWVEAVDVQLWDDLYRIDVLSTDGLGRLAGTQIEIAPPVPAELTGARINRILDAAGWPTAMRAIDTGVTQCSALNRKLTGDALTLCTQTADTDPGRFVYKPDPDEMLSFLSASNRGDHQPQIVSDAESGKHLHWAQYPVAASDRELLITQVAYEDADEDLHTARDDAAAGLYGEWTLWRSFWTDPSRSKNTADALLKGLSRPRVRVRDVRLALHLETPETAHEAMAGHIGDQVSTFVRRGTLPEASVGMIDGIYAEVSPIYPPSGQARADMVWELIPVDIYSEPDGLIFLAPDVGQYPVNEPMSITLQPAENATGTVTYTAEDLPGGLTLSGLTISGTPTALAVTQVTVRATDQSVPPKTAAVMFDIIVISDISWTWGHGTVRVPVGMSVIRRMLAPTGAVPADRRWFSNAATISGLSVSFDDDGGEFVAITFTSASHLTATRRDSLQVSVTDGKTTDALLIDVIQYVPIAIAAPQPLGGLVAFEPVTVYITPSVSGGSGKFLYSTTATGFDIGLQNSTLDALGRLGIVGKPTGESTATFTVTVRDEIDPDNTASAVWTAGVIRKPQGPIDDSQGLTCVSRPPGVGAGTVWRVRYRAAGATDWTVSADTVLPRVCFALDKGEYTFQSGWDFDDGQLWTAQDTVNVQRATVPGPIGAGVSTFTALRPGGIDTSKDWVIDWRLRSASPAAWARVTVDADDTKETVRAVADPPKQYWAAMVRTGGAEPSG